MNRLSMTLATATAVLALGSVGLAQQKPVKSDAGRGSPAVAQNHRASANERVRPERPDRPARPDRPGNPDRPERPDRPDRPGFGSGPFLGNLPDGLPFLRGMAKFWENPEVVEAIGLTSNQIQALAESHELTRQALDATEGSIRTAHENLRSIMDADSPALVDALEAVDSLTATTNEKMKIVFGHLVVVKNVLTAEQEEALKQFVHENRPRPEGPRFGGPGSDEKPGRGPGAGGPPPADGAERPGFGRGPRDGAGPGRGPGAGDAPAQRLRVLTPALRELIAPMLEDGTIDDAERAAIEEAIADLDPHVQDAVRAAVERLASGERPAGRPYLPNRPERSERPGLPALNF